MLFLTIQTRAGAVVAALLICSAFTLTPAAAHAKCIDVNQIIGIELPAGCLSPDEGSVLQMRVFRADLVVAALSCNAKAQYNRLVARHQEEFVRGGRALRALFSRLHNSEATRELDRFVTRLTNRASQRRLAARGYCRAMALVFEQAFALPSHKLKSYVMGRPVRTTINVASAATGN